MQALTKVGAFARLSTLAISHLQRAWHGSIHHWWNSVAELGVCCRCTGHQETHPVGRVHDCEPGEAAQHHALPQQREGRRDHGLASHTRCCSGNGKEHPASWQLLRPTLMMAGDCQHSPAALTSRNRLQRGLRHLRHRLCRQYTSPLPALWSHRARPCTCPVCCSNSRHSVVL